MVPQFGGKTSGGRPNGGPPTRGPATSAGAGTTVQLAGRVPADAAADAADDESGVLLVQVPEGFLGQHELLDLLFHDDVLLGSFVDGDGLHWPSVPTNEARVRKSSPMFLKKCPDPLKLPR